MVELEPAARHRHVPELASIDKRMKYINGAIILSTLSALLICLVIATLFTGQLLNMDLSNAVATLFVASMTALIAGLVSFLSEVSIATRTLRVTPHLLASKAVDKLSAPIGDG